MKEFIEVTGLNNNRVFIKASAVEGIVQGERKTKVFTKGALVPYEIKENAEDVVALINEINNKGATTTVVVNSTKSMLDEKELANIIAKTSKVYG